MVRVPKAIWDFCSRKRVERLGESHGTDGNVLEIQECTSFQKAQNFWILIHHLEMCCSCNKYNSSTLFGIAGSSNMCWWSAGPCIPETTTLSLQPFHDTVAYAVEF